MKIKEFKYETLGETLYEYEHESGLKAYVIPKKGYKKTYATFATHYGSLNNRFIDSTTNEEVQVPDGIAHFLEHKLFEQEYGNVMEKFSKLGANPNAYTGFAQTVYLFSCTDKFKETFETLLEFVQSPYLTDENVESEKGIIGQEINMLQDSGARAVYFNLLNALYKNNPVKIEIGGTIESISHINKELLYKCYNEFYHPSNMMIVVVGDVNHEEVFEIVNDKIKRKDKREPIKRLYPEEPECVAQKIIEETKQIAMPIFLMGYKDNEVSIDGRERVKKEICIDLLLEIMMGRSSKLYQEMYNLGLIDNSFSYEYTTEECYAYSNFGGQTKYPHKVKDKILEAINEFKKNGIKEEDLNRIKKSNIGNFIKGFNYVEQISNTFIELYFKGVKSLDCYEILKEITLDDILYHLNNHFDEERLAISIVNPK